ncbi:hypothetical protein [Endozoicomonas sp. Mp262]|uniref:PP2C family protein-serine/threonine phosphatase n=1 Tax=Endozoicomonas sp. Mp262 TaxID=2919499 RepID=UPI0021D82EAE
MTPKILTSQAGGVESLNADHVEHWPIEKGHIYLICDGINHTEHTATTVKTFCTMLKATDWSHSESPETQLTRNILSAMRSLSTNDQGTAFCLSMVLLTRDYMVIGHCGDCRAGLLTNKGVEWLTEDDVPFLSMYQQGKLTQEQYNQSRHLLTCKLKTGQHNQGQLKTKVLPIPSQPVILCTDGFWSECEHLLTGHADSCLQIIHQQIPLLTAEAQDNFSVIVVEN